jgi:glucokinase
MPVDWVVVGLDNGGTANNGTILDSSGRFLLDRMAEVPSDVREGPDKAIQSLVVSVEQVLGLTGVPITAVRAVGLDTPGPASGDGVISSKGATNFGHVGWRGFDIRGALAERLGLPVIYNNDGNAAALYAHNVRFGAESGQRSSVAAIVGTGLGGGIIQAGQVVKGAAGMAGELGHVPIPLDGLLGDGQPMPACNCGQSGDAESVASLTGIQNNLLPHWLSRYPGHDLGELPIGTAAKLVRKYAEDGDEMALTIFRQQAMALGRLFTIAANFLDPDEYFLGGGVVEATPHFRDWFFAEVRAHTVLREEQARAAEISLVADLDMAGARGSAYAARDWLISQGQQVRPATLLFLGRRDDHHHGEARRLIARVLVPVRAAGRETGALAGADSVRLAATVSVSVPDSTQTISRVAGAWASPPNDSPGITSQRHSSAAHGGSVAPMIVPVPPEGPRQSTREASGLLTWTAGSPPRSTRRVTGTPKASPMRARVARLGFERPCSSATSTPLLTPNARPAGLATSCGRRARPAASARPRP